MEELGLGGNFGGKNLGEKVGRNFLGEDFKICVGFYLQNCHHVFVF